MEIFSQRLKEARESSHLTQKKMAEVAGVSQQYYGRFEKNQSQPNLETLVKMALELGVTTDYLLGMPDKTPSNKLSVNGTEFEITISIKTKEPSSFSAKNTEDDSTIN